MDEGIQDPEFRGAEVQAVISTLATAQVQAGRIEEALATVGNVHDDRTLVEIYQNIIRRLIGRLEPE